MIFVVVADLRVWNPCSCILCHAQITTSPSCSGKACPSLSETIDCNPGCCSVECSVGQWSPWSVCSKSCGGGSETRSRNVLISPSCGGSGCPNLFESRICNDQCCPVGTIFPFFSWSVDKVPVLQLTIEFPGLDSSHRLRGGRVELLLSLPARQRILW